MPCGPHLIVAGVPFRRENQPGLVRDRLRRNAPFILDLRHKVGVNQQRVAWRQLDAKTGCASTGRRHLDWPQVRWLPSKLGEMAREDTSVRAVSTGQPNDQVVSLANPARTMQPATRHANTARLYRPPLSFQSQARVFANRWLADSRWGRVNTIRIVAQPVGRGAFS